MNTPRAAGLKEIKRAGGLPGKFQMPKNSRQPEILLLEDSAGLFPKIGPMLQNQGFLVTLAPEADIVLEKVRNNNFAAVIVGVSQEQPAGLDVLAAVKEKNLAIKTMVVTSLVNPVLPLKAYEIEIDDYIHWPLSSTELGGRLKNLLEPDWGESTNEGDHPDQEAQNKIALTAMGSLVEGFTSSLGMIARSLEDIRQEHLEDMEEGLSEELFSLAMQVQNLSDNLRQCHQLGIAAEPCSLDQEKRLH